MDFKEFEFAVKPEKSADHLVRALTDKFSNPAVSKLDVARIIAGFSSIMIATGKGFDSLYFSYMREAAIKSGKLPEPEFYELLTTLPEGGYGEFLSIGEIAEKVDNIKKDGLNVGLKLGHYRRLTVSQIFELTSIRHGCDHLVLLMESGERTSVFKNKRIEMTDAQRINMFKSSCLVNTIGITDGMDYSNAYYRDLITAIKPTTLFISSLWPQEMQEEYRKRAALCGADPFLIPNFNSQITTTVMEPYIFPQKSR